jgi:hypothetical protein
MKGLVEAVPFDPLRCTVGLNALYKGKLCSGDVPCITQEEQGFGPSTLSTYPLPIYLRYLLGAQFISNLGSVWTGPYHIKEGFQVSKREWDCKNRDLARGAKQRDCAITCVSICIHVYNNCLNVVNNLNCVWVINKP